MEKYMYIARRKNRAADVARSNPLCPAARISERNALLRDDVCVQELGDSVGNLYMVRAALLFRCRGMDEE